ncbi:hypothetical protein Dimus_031954 [Dionaea muscipula]
MRQKPLSSPSRSQFHLSISTLFHPISLPKSTPYHSTPHHSSPFPQNRNPTFPPHLTFDFQPPSPPKPKPPPNSTSSTMPRVRLARVEAYEFDDFRFPSPFHEQQQWPQFLNRGPINSISVTSSKISEKVTAKACNRGNPRVDDEVAQQAPAASVAPALTLAPVPAQFAQFLQTVTRSLKDLQRRYTELRADTLHGSSPLARLKATQAS